MIYTRNNFHKLLPDPIDIQVVTNAPSDYTTWPSSKGWYLVQRDTLALLDGIDMTTTAHPGPFSSEAVALMWAFWVRSTHG